MKLTDAAKNSLLAKIGLQSEMTWKDTDPFIFDPNIFGRYITQEYLNSSRKESDEIYRMSEMILLHKASGMRVICVETESYFGDESIFKLDDIFIITLQKERHAVEDIDFSNNCFISSGKEIPFSVVKKDNN